MADSSVTITGLDELRRAIEPFPDHLQTALRAIAHATAQRIQAGARERLLAQTHGSGATAAAITVDADEGGRMFHVISKAPRGRAANLPLFLEHGTVRMTARPYMRPAAEAETARYVLEIEAAATALLQKAIG